ncbi:MAG: thioredoxin [Candidatus Omnitrophica bacterium]|nr:thioredoxin [Candidatus Omnitrophota bacterium]
MAIIEINKDNYEEIVKRAEKPVLIDLWAPWCMPCKMLSPVIDQISEQYEGKIIVAKVNVDDSPEIASELAVLNIPTLIFFKNGQEQGRSSGMLTKEALEFHIEEYFGA